MRAFFDTITNTSAGQDKFLKVVQNVIRLLLSLSLSWKYKCRLQWLDKSFFMRLRAEIGIAVKLTRIYSVPGHLQQLADAICCKSEPALLRILRVAKALGYTAFAIGDLVNYLSTIAFTIPAKWKPKITRASVHALLLATICQFLMAVMSSTKNIKFTYQRTSRGLKLYGIPRFNIAKQQELRTVLSLLSATCDMVSAVAGAGYKEVNDATLGILGSLSGGSGLTLIVAK
ncbi:hypothetical protein AFCA_000963 [Aspergillus flavus]|uniref:Peroxisomal biogenesis factor 11 n=1 Tax=Aspergillus flavus TaxID=5059 RepID=A0AB74BNZ1_ASPFL|nr:hypothetical protein NYO67_781 [Aspergillus flavus]RMZ36134.1 hypothetical protein CA14_009845 [Aspergillus flavus]UCK58095.1 hypothetical protein AFCA_000963 [Aspergillus flavus]